MSNSASRESLDNLLLLKAILAPSIDFGLLNPLAVRGFNVQGRLAPTAVEVVRAKKSVILEGYEKDMSDPGWTLYSFHFPSMGLSLGLSIHNRSGRTERKRIDNDGRSAVGAWFVTSKRPNHDH
jgi:hypothetical protein